MRRIFSIPFLNVSLVATISRISTVSSFESGIFPSRSKQAKGPKNINVVTILQHINTNIVSKFQAKQRTEKKRLSWVLEFPVRLYKIRDFLRNEFHELTNLKIMKFWVVQCLNRGGLNFSMLSNFLNCTIQLSKFHNNSTTFDV